MIIPFDVEKAFDKHQQPIISKVLEISEFQSPYLNMVKSNIQTSSQYQTKWRETWQSYQNQGLDIDIHSLPTCLI